MNLDRFSVPMAWEYMKDVEGPYEVESVEPVKCCGCGCELDLDDVDDFVESEFYEEEYIHQDQDCIRKYYENEKRIALGSNSY